MVHQSLLSLGSSLLALALLVSPIEGSTVWSVSSGVLGAGVVGLLLASFRLLRENRRVGRTSNLWLAAASLLLLMPASLLALANAFVVTSPAFWGFFAPLMALQFLTGLAFVRMVSVRLPRT